MTRHIRYTLDPEASSTTPDGAPGVVRARLERDAPLPEAVRLLPPSWPSKIVCVGRNYVEHAKELGNPIPSEPLIFLKPPSSLLASGDSIVYPSISTAVHHEAELGVVIGERARNVKAEDWERY